MPAAKGTTTLEVLGVVTGMDPRDALSKFRAAQEKAALIRRDISAWRQKCRS
jgi:hypothetical protein